MPDDGDYQPIPASEYAPGGAYVQGIMQQFQEAAGNDDEYRMKALEGQLKSAEAARQNAMKIAQLQASTSRYGIDAQSATAMRALKENARQFDAQHGLEIAKAYTAFASTPDLMFARNDFVDAMGRVGQGLSPQASITRNPGPVAKTYEDFSALAQYNGSQVPGASSDGGGGGGSSQPAAASGGGGEAKDPRIAAANAIVKALPPSDNQGHDGQDWAAINAMRSLYSSGRPGIEARLGASRTKTGLAAIARAGFDPNLVHEEYTRALPGQGSPIRAA